MPVIDRQVDAFSTSADAVIAASYEACDVHDLVLAAIGIAKMASLSFEASPIRWKDDSDTFVGLLRKLVEVQHHAEGFENHGTHAEMMNELNEGIVRIRECLADIQDLQLSPEARQRNADIISSLDYEKLCAEARRNSTPEAADNENFRRLRRPE